MKAFHNDPKIKTKYLNRVQAHRKADELVQGHGYWKDGKGCAVGCTIHGEDHKAYETELGIPEWLARLEDTLFEGLTKKRAKLWPEQFLSVIKVGSDLDKVKAQFLIFILNRALLTFDHTQFPDVAEILHSVIMLYEIGEATEQDFKEAAEAAWAARVAAVRSIAWAAWATARSAEAAEAAEAAARSIERAAWAVDAAGAAGAAWAAWAAAAEASTRAGTEYGIMADELLLLLKEAR